MKPRNLSQSFRAVDLMVAALAQLLLAGPVATQVADTAVGRTRWIAHESGTSVALPSVEHSGIRVTSGRWRLMFSGTGSFIYRDDPGPRGDNEGFSTNMLMVMATRGLGPGRLTLRLMGSLEATGGRDGYPLLLQTGETSDGVLPLTDRQHPHDLIMEASAEYQIPVSPRDLVFFYAAPVGAPAIGPTAFMHRGSGRTNPVAPISHHFLDATHIAHGVLTLGLVTDNKTQIEASVFNGREPDQNRWGPETPRFDSWAFRATSRPSDKLVLQGSVAQLIDPEQLHPGISVLRLTLSATYNRPLGNGEWQTTLALGRNKNEEAMIPLREARRTFSPAVLDHFIGLAELPNIPEDSLILFFPSQITSALLLESSLRHGAATVFGRLETGRKTELLPPADSRHSSIFSLGKIEGGLVYDILSQDSTIWGVGIAGALHWVDDEIKPDYGGGLQSVSVFTRIQF